MRKTYSQIKCFVFCLALVWLSAGYVAASQYVVVVLAHDGTGDFGPQTPGTKTYGWQEAINYCKASYRDLYVKGGGVYDVSDTIYIPPFQYLTIDGGNYTVNWMGSADKDMLVIDSAMDARFNLGNFAYSGTGAAIRFKPANPVPIDNFVAMGDSEFRIRSVENPYVCPPGKQRVGTGIVFDTSLQVISDADFYVGAIRNFGTCISVPSSNAGFFLNRVRCPDLRTNTANCTLLSLGGSCDRNIFELGIGVDQGAAGIKGVDVFGTNNSLDVHTTGGFSQGNGLILESGASGNQVNLTAGSDVTNPLSLVTDNASNATNQVTCSGPQLPIIAIAATTGTYTYIQRLYSASARVVGGTVTDIKFVRGADTRDYGTSRTDVILGVGDQLQVTSTVAPTIQIIPLKVE